MMSWATRLIMCRKLISQIIATSVNTIRTLDRQGKSWWTNKTTASESVPKGGAVAGGNRCVVILWISHTNRGRTSVDVVVRCQCKTMYAVKSLELSPRCRCHQDVDEVVVWEQSREERFPKTLFAFPVQDRKDDGSRDLLTQSQVHANDRVGVLALAAQQREEAKSNSYRSP
jgi:hypothetical protein